MSIVVDGVSQGSPEWFAMRLGSPGASSISKIITTTGVRSKQANDYMWQLAGEIVTGQYEETFQSIHMENGKLREAEARTFFEMINDVTVRQVALVYKDKRKVFHCSPDGLIGNDAGLELKNPMMKTQVKYLLANKLPTEYFSQVQMSLYVCELEHWWFCSYYAGLPSLIINVERDEGFIEKLSVELECFVEELAFTVKKLRKLQ